MDALVNMGKGYAHRRGCPSDAVYATAAAGHVGLSQNDVGFNAATRAGTNADGSVPSAERTSRIRTPVSSRSRVEFMPAYSGFASSAPGAAVIVTSRSAPGKLNFPAKDRSGDGTHAVIGPAPAGSILRGSGAAGLPAFATVVFEATAVAVLLAPFELLPRSANAIPPAITAMARSAMSAIFRSDDRARVTDSIVSAVNSTAVCPGV
jgi:hypothetical protein